jgi:GH24 family phage-related lysozyme (muramidase)
MGLMDTLRGLFKTDTVDHELNEVTVPTNQEVVPVAPMSFEEFMSKTAFVGFEDPSSSTGTVALESKPIDKTPSMDDDFETTSGAPAHLGKRFENLSPLEGQILFHEGVRDRVYVDPGGNLAIGVGFNLDRGDAKDKIESLGLDYKAIRSGRVRLNDDQIVTLFKQDVSTAVNDAKHYAGEAWDTLSDIRKRVLTDMSYTLGANRLAKFVTLKKALLEGNYILATASMMRSKWYKQVKSRGKRLARAMADDVLDIV